MIYYHIQHFGPCPYIPWLIRLLDAKGNVINFCYDGTVQALDDVTAQLRENFDLAATVRFRLSKSIRWCGPSQATALLESLEDALEDAGWEYFINLSGACFPLASQSAILGELIRRSRLGLLIHMFYFPVRKIPAIVGYDEEAASCTQRFGRLTIHATENVINLFSDRTTSPIKNPQNRVFLHCDETPLDKSLCVRGLTDEDNAFRQSYFVQFPHFCGRAWFILHRSACEKIVSVLRNEPLHLKLFSSCFEPDESFFQTVILGRPDVFKQQSISADNLRLNLGRARNVTDADLPWIVTAKGFFGRKIVHPKSPHLMHYIETRVR